MRRYLSNSNWPRLLLLFLISLLVYHNVLNAYFQQDEWHAFGYHILLKNLDTANFLKSVFVSSIFHYTPLTVLSIKLFFSLFKFNYASYALVSIGLHIVVTSLLFYFSRILFKNNFLALTSSILFSVMAAGSQATTWVVADVGTHTATIFALLTMIAFSYFLSKGGKFWLIVSLIFLIGSLLFKEITVGLFLFLPIYYLLFGNLKKNFKIPVLIFSVGGLYILFRISLFLLASNELAPTLQNSQTIRIVNFVFLPIKAVAQTIIPSDQLLQTSYNLATNFPNIASKKGTTAFDIFAQKRVLPVLEILLFLLVVVGVYMIRKKQDNQLVRLSVFGLVFVILNSLVYAYSPQKTGTIHIIDSRNLYFPSIGTVLLVVALVSYLIKNKTKILLLLAPIIILNIFWLRKELLSLTEIGNLRKNILYQIKDQYPTLPEKVVFYTQSDTSYYGLPPADKIMPFQSGFGQTLLVWYYEGEKWPTDFFQNQFLWEITSQGYRESDGRGFGYFRNWELLQKTMTDYKLPQESVVSFSWDSRYNALMNTTEQIRKRLDSSR